MKSYIFFVFLFISFVSYGQLKSYKIFNYPFIDDDYSVYYGDYCNINIKSIDSLLKKSNNIMHLLLIPSANDSITITINDTIYFEGNLFNNLSSKNNKESELIIFRYLKTNFSNKINVLKIYSHTSNTKLELVLDTRFSVLHCYFTNKKRKKKKPNWSFAYSYSYQMF